MQPSFLFHASQPDGLQHTRWSSNCNDERSTAKRSNRAARAPPARVTPQSPSYVIREECECRDSRDGVPPPDHPHRRKDASPESIALCQLTRSPDRKVVTINLPRAGRRGDASAGERRRDEGETARYAKLRSQPESEPCETKPRKCMNSLENISDSIQSLLGCTPGYCQSKKGPGDGKRRYERGATKSELEPLFFVGDKELYYNKESPADTKIVVHHCPKHGEERDEAEEVLPLDPRPKRYSRSSLKKQKVSLYNEKELDLYMKVPMAESHPVKKENKATETEKTKSSSGGSSGSRDNAEMKRKTFLRKISLQDTYLNYNQDYWLDYKKSVRFHKSIDLGYFGDEENGKKGDAAPDKLRPRLSERITEKSGETMDEPEMGRQVSTSSLSSLVPYEGDGAKTPNSTESAAGRRRAATAVMADFRKAAGLGPAKSLFPLPSSENIPLFSERNGYIETDFDVFGDSRDDECLLIEKADEPGAETAREVRLTLDGSTDGSEQCPSETRTDSFDLKRRYDFSQFYEIQLTAEDPVRRSTVFNFQGGHAFFGETRNSTSDESDVFYNEPEVGDGPERAGQGCVGRVLFVPGPDKSRDSEMV